MMNAHEKKPRPYTWVYGSREDMLLYKFYYDEYKNIYTGYNSENPSIVQLDFVPFWVNQHLTDI